MSAVETTSLMNDVVLNVSQLRILLRILCNKVGVNFFEPETLWKVLAETWYVQSLVNINIIIWKKKVNLNIFFWVRDTVAIFKKETQLLIESSDINISNINRIDIVVGGDHGQRAFRFPMKLLYIMNNGIRHERI